MASVGLTLAAIHEAAHALVAWKCGVRIRSVEIGPQGKTTGRVGIEWKETQFDAVLATSLAGSVGVELTFGHETFDCRNWGEEGDLEMGGGALDRMGLEDHQERTRAVGLAMAMAEGIIKRYWSSYLALARVLEERRSMTGAEAVRIMREASKAT